MVEGFFISFNGAEIRRAILIIASHAKGGITEWLNMDSDEFVLWLDALKDLQRDGRK